MTSTLLSSRMRKRTALMAVTFAMLFQFSPAQAQSGKAAHEHDMPDPTKGKQGIEHTALLRTDVVDANGQEVIVWDTEYAPRAINPRHYHPSAITFYIISGSGIWHEEGKEAITLKAGESLFVPAGTTHSHWNPSHTEKLRFLEFIVGPKDKSRPVPSPRPSN